MAGRFDRNVAMVLARPIFFVKARRLFFRGGAAGRFFLLILVLFFIGQVQIRLRATDDR